MRTRLAGGRTGRRRYCWLLVPAALAGALVVAPSAGSAAPCSERTAVAGIAVVKGCLSSVSATPSGEVSSGVAEGPQDVDLNGFIVRLGQDDKLSVNTGTREITTHGSKVQLGSKNWPTSGKVDPFPPRFALSFIAPLRGSMALEDLGAFPAMGKFFGDLFSVPLGTLASIPLRLHESGEGSMDITVALRGYFTLKGKEQSVKIRFPTASGKGTRFDGFKFELNEIDALKAITLENLRAEYSAQKQRVGGSATVTFPFSKGGKAQRGLGFGVGFLVEKGALSELSGKVAGVKIPVGSGGFITDIDALIRLRNAQCGPPINATIGVRGAFEPELETQLGKIPPVAARSTLGFSTTPQCDTIFKLTGGLEIFRLPVGDASIEVYTSGAIRAGAGLGIGFPSYRNRPDDPFYIGARVGGWFADRKFQLTGSGRVRLARLNLFDGRILLNHRAVGACWKVIGFPGGAVYEYRKRAVETFGVGCGLDRFSEQFPRGASASQSRPRRIRLDRGEVVLHARGRGGPPRFTAHSSDGRVYSAPAPGSRPCSKSRNHLFFVNQTGTNTTHLFIRRPRGTWTITPHAGSPPITSLKAGRRQPRERVRAEVRGTGAVRELVWRSRGRRNTRLIFSEILRGGVEIPILNTDREDGRHVFRVAERRHYGPRRL
ncbi:MAG: hypothetical protein M3088_04270, partial [Actinomycetota bacterium]|nr:hypothetical protein [Actinomycetota bacterium]